MMKNKFFIFSVFFLLFSLFFSCATAIYVNEELPEDEIDISDNRYFIGHEHYMEALIRFAVEYNTKVISYNELSGKITEQISSVNNGKNILNGIVGGLTLLSGGVLGILASSDVNVNNETDVISGIIVSESIVTLISSVVNLGLERNTSITQQNYQQFTIYKDKLFQCKTDFLNIHQQAKILDATRTYNEDESEILLTLDDLSEKLHSITDSVVQLSFGDFEEVYIEDATTTNEE